MFFRDLFRQILVWFRVIQKPDFYIKLVSQHPAPETVKAMHGQVLVVGDKKLKKWVCLNCPDNCGEIILLSLNKSRRPSWSISIDRIGRPSLSPSIRKLDGCKSHFWLRDGFVDWCNDSGK